MGAFIEARVAGTSYLVLEGHLVLPARGVWLAEVVLQSLDASLSGPVTLSWAGQTFTGAISTLGTDGRGRVRGQVLGGAGNLADTLPAKGYQQTTLRSVLADTLSAAGEALSATADSAALSLSAPFWARRAGPVADTVRLVASLAGATWRTLPDGTLWVGTDAWAEAPKEDTRSLLQIAREQRRREFSTYTAQVLPGCSLLGEHVVSVEYAARPDGHRMTVWGEE